VTQYTRYKAGDDAPLGDAGRARRQRERRRRRGAWRWARWVVLLLVLLLVAGLATGAGVIYALTRNLPSLDDLQKNETAVNTVIYDRDGEVIAELHGAENRVLVKSDQISDVMKQATVAVEDERFYDHHGVDAIGITRAMVENLKAGAVVQGGSTITAQYVKNAYVGGERSVARKLREAVLSWQLEDRWPKDRILTAYLNTVYFGAGAYGVEAASRTYFHKNAEYLTLKEAALLAALIRLPSKYAPTTDPKQAKERRNLVLDMMATQGYITQARADEAKERKLGVFKDPPNTNNSEAAYFVDYVTRQLIKKYGAAQTFNGGLRVHTSIDMDWQKAGLAAISSTIGDLDYGGWGPAGAMVAIDPETGYIRTMVGGSDFKKQKFNLAWQARRQAGSAMKTFVLTSAVDMGMNPASTYYVSHSPTIIPMGAGAEPWIVNTYDHSSAGRITVSAATVRSDNSVYAQLCMDTGPENVVATAQTMGITSPLAAVPSITLGTEAVNPLEMASAYATLASGGIYHRPQAIVKVIVPGGEVDWKPKTKGRRVLSAGVAYTVNRILQTNATSGTGAGTSAYVSRTRAGKTGTTDNYVDAWYCGYTPNLSTAVWMGYPGDYNHPMPGVAGSTYCVPMWGKFNKVALADLPADDFEYASMIFKPWKGKYSTMSPSPTESSGTPKPDKTVTVRPTANPTATITTKPSPTPTKTPKPSPTPTSTGVGAKVLTGVAPPAAGTTGEGGEGPVSWFVDAVGGLLGF
jgi:penicillin-binding protein 1A